MIIYLTHSGQTFFGGIMHTLENIGFLRVVVLLKQTLYGPILVEMVENSNDCKIFTCEDIGFKLKYDVAKTFK